MSRWIVIGLLSFSIIFSAFSAKPLRSYSETRNGNPISTESPISKERIAKAWARLPIAFEPNAGQFDSEFEFGSRGPGFALSLTATTVEMGLSSKGASKPNRLRFNLAGGNSDARLNGVDKLPGESNYFRGPREQWITHVPTYQRVIAENVYPGVDVAYYGNHDHFEYDFSIKPGFTSQSIDVEVDGTSNIHLTESGDLGISLSNGELLQAKPVVYQDINGQRRSVEAEYVLRGAKRFGFEIGPYDRSRPLIIDPQVIYSVYAAPDSSGIAVDAAGNAYICGVSPDSRDGNYTDAFVMKLNAAGTAMVYSNRFGSPNMSDGAEAVAVDSAGNASVTGFTFGDNPSTGWYFPTINPIEPTQRNGYQARAFITKFNSTGSMVYSTTLGGSQWDWGYGIAVDSIGNMYVVGQTYSRDFPVWNALQPTCRRCSDPVESFSDAFVSVLNPAGSAFIFSTFVGGTYNDAATAIAIDASGNSYVTGFTESSDFPTSVAIRPTFSGGHSDPDNRGKDAFVFKLNPAGSAFHYSTYLGGNGDDWGYGIAADSSGNAYVVGTTNSTNFPTFAAFQSGLSGYSDAFVTKINSAGSALSYSTYLGGAGYEGGNGIAVNGAGNAYVTGWTGSLDFPQLRSLHSFRGSGAYDAFVTALAPNGSTLVYSTGLDGTGNSIGVGIASDWNANVYVTGTTMARDFPTTSSGPGSPPTGDRLSSQSGFVVKLMNDPPAAPSWTRFEQTDSRVTYTGTWYRVNSGIFSGGSAVEAVTPGARATFAFNGTAARWIGYKDRWSGMARIYVDGVLQATVDTYSATDQAKVVMYTTPALAAGTHTLTVEVAGARNASSQGNWIWVDAFEQAP